MTKNSNKPHKKKLAKQQQQKQEVVATPAAPSVPESPTHLLKKLATAEDSIDDRAWAAAAIANLCSNPETRTLLLNENVAGYLVDAFHTAVLAKEFPVLLQVAAAIRNLVVDTGGQDDQVLAEFVRKDILRPVLLLIPILRDEIFYVKDKVVEDIHTLVKQVLYIIWMLWYAIHTKFSESLDSATQAFSTDETFLMFIIRIFNPEFVTSTFGDAIGIVSSAARVFLTLTEDNAQITPYLKRGAKVLAENLTLITSNESIVIGPRLLACGILNNLDVYHKKLEAVYEKIFPVFSTALQYDLSAAIANVASGEDTDGIPVILKDAGNVVLALELASNALSFNPPSAVEEKPSKDYDQQIEGEEGEEDEEEMSMDIEMDDDEDEEEMAPAAPLPVLDQLESLLLSLCKTIISSPPNMSSSAFTTILSTILTRSLTCLADIYLSNPLRGSIQSNTQLCSWLSDLFVSGAGLAISSASLDGMYALSKSSVVVGEYSDALVESLINTMGGDEASSAKVVAILARVGTHPCSVARNERIGDLFLNVLDQGAAVPAAVVFEVLDALFDVYADADFEYDAGVFRARGYLARLKGLVPSVRAIVRSVDRRMFREVRGKGDECLINLRGFIQYKEGELCSFS